MAIRPIRIIGDPVLRTVCDPITEITPNVKALVEDLLEGVDKDGRAGLAANQIGVSLRAVSWTERAWYARCEGTDLDGKKVVVEGEELMARCIQHECDHLDGHIYIDRLDRPTRKKALRDIRNAGF